MFKEHHYFNNRGVKPRPPGVSMRTQHGRMHMPIMGYRPMWFGEIFRPYWNWPDEIDDKEEAITFLEMQFEAIRRRQKELAKDLKKLDLATDQITKAIKEVGGLKEFSSSELRKILRKNHFTLMKNVFQEE